MHVFVSVRVKCLGYFNRLDLVMLYILVCTCIKLHCLPISRLKNKINIGPAENYDVCVKIGLLMRIVGPKEEEVIRG
jgi:hypothetical protein